MGGFFGQQQQPATVVSPINPAVSPFFEQLIQAVARQFQSPVGGVTPLEESTIRGAFQNAEPSRQMLQQTVQGQYLPPGQAAQPGQQPDVSNVNPFLGSLMQGLERQGDVARRQLASAAQRAGALTGTDYTRQASDLEANLASGRGQLLSDVYGTERNRQFQAVPQLQQLGSSLLGFAGVPRQVATEATRYPFQLGANLIGAGGSPQYIPGKTSPSPFSSLLGGFGQLLGAGAFPNFFG